MVKTLRKDFLDSVVFTTVEFTSESDEPQFIKIWTLYNTDFPKMKLTLA